jgi:ubiquinone/menaquinone biosynthesis C-methylase UbiE
VRNVLDLTFAHPRGFLGRLGGIVMARFANVRNDWTLSLLTPAPDAHILEVGFGPGTLIAALASAVPGGTIDGIDLSPVMLKQATARNQRAIDEHCVHLRSGSATALPFADASFDLVVSANSIFFWPEQHASVREIYRVLKPDGQLVLILQPIWAKSTEEVQGIGQEYMRMLAAEGYQQVRSAVQSMRPIASAAVFGSR